MLRGARQVGGRRTAGCTGKQRAAADAGGRRTEARPHGTRSDPRAAGLLAAILGGTGCVPADRKDELPSIPIGGATTIYDVHTGVVASGDEVVLSGVVAGLPRSPPGAWFVVQDPAGGEYAGLEVFLLHALPGVVVAPGDILTLRGVLSTRNGRLGLALDSAAAIVHTGTTELAATPVGPVADWSPYNGVLVDPGPTTVLDCGDLAGQATTDRDLAIDLTHVPTPAVLGTGPLSTGLRGVLHGVPRAWSLSPRSEAELGDAPTDGCPTTIAATRSADDLPGRLALPEVRVTAVQPDGGRAFVQDLDGGSASGLELVAPDRTLDTLAPGDHLAVAGLLRDDTGPLQLVVTAQAPIDRSTSPLLDRPDSPFDPAWDGALVELGPVSVTGSPAAGRAATDLGVELVDVLLDGTALPGEGTWLLRGALRVDARDAPPTVQLLPRGPGDWDPVP